MGDEGRQRRKMYVRFEIVRKEDEWMVQDLAFSNRDKAYNYMLARNFYGKAKHSVRYEQFCKVLKKKGVFEDENDTYLWRVTIKEVR